MKDYYELLGIEKDATKKEIKKNYYLLANKFHPDKNPHPDAASKFIVINEAYEVLSNKKTRALYDLKRWQILKEAKKTDDSYGIVVPPTESLRSRRNKAQEKRSLKYHQTSDGIPKKIKLITESLHIVARYGFHILGIALISVILVSAMKEFYKFESSIGIGVGMFAFIILLAYTIYRLVQNIFEEITIDIRRFSMYYKVAHRKAFFYSVSVFTFVIVLFIAILQAY